MNALVNPITLSQEDIRWFAESGAIKLKKIFTAEAIDQLRHLTSKSQPKQEYTEYSSDFKKLVYDIEHDITHAICKSSEFKGVVEHLVESGLIFAQGVDFELMPNQRGATWHLDTVSFSYVMPEDQAYTLWIPLDPINTSEQDGGIAYVPRSAYSGDALFSLLDQLVRHGKVEQVSQLEDFKRSNFQYASQVEEVVLESCKVAHDFEVGDALLLDKFVWHKSCPLREGVLPSRRAYGMRFVGGKSRYSQMFRDGMYSLIRASGEEPQTNFAYTALGHLNDGDVITEKNIARLTDVKRG